MTHDPDFPAPVRPARPAHIVSQAVVYLDTLAEHDAEAVAWAAYDWLNIRAAGLPMLPLIDGTARDDARFWAETANPSELECYALAAVDRLGGMSGGHALFASRQIKRLVGALWRRMSPSEQSAFAKWATDQMEGKK
jgi:hypothetical protein